SGGRPPPPPPRGRPAKSPPKPAGAEARGKKAPKRKTMVMTTSRNLPPPPGKRSRPGGAGPAGKPAPDPPTVPLASFKPGGAPPKPKAKPVPKPTGKPAPKPTASYAASAPSSDFDWDDDELETRLFEDGDEPGPSKGGGARTSSPGEPARNGLSSVPTKVDVGAKAPVPSVIAAPGVAASTDPGPDKGMTMVPGQMMASPHMQMPASPAPVQGGQGAPLAPGFGSSAPASMPQPGMPQPGMPQPGGYPGAPAVAMAGAPGMVPSGSGMAMPPGVGGYDYDDRPRKSNAGPIVVIVVALLVLFTAALGGFYVLLKDKGKEGSSKGGSPAATESPEAGGVKDPSSAGAAQAALTVLVTPPDARVSVDGKEQSASSTVVVSVTPGKHAVKVTHDAHFDFETEVDVTAAGLRLPVALQPKAVKLSFELVPAEAKASLLSGGQVVGTGSNGSQLPVVRKPNVEYEVEVSAPGYTSQRDPLVFSGAASQTVVVTLAKASGGTPSTTPTPPSTTPKSKPKPKPKPKPVAKTSTLRLGIKGGVLPAKAYVDGKYVGTTPVLNVKVTPGKHTVKFTWTDGRAAQTINVNVADGATEVVKGG
ncbi:MAG: PEGA domain-containing protein, partial [Nannocystaceae bacterium]